MNVVNIVNSKKHYNLYDQIFDYLTVDKGNFPKASQFFEEPIYDRNYYDLLCDQFRSPHLWKRKKDIQVMYHL